MTKSLLSNPKHWRDRAEKTLTKGDETYSPQSKKRFLRIAQEYQRLAEMDRALFLRPRAEPKIMSLAHSRRWAIDTAPANER